MAQRTTIAPETTEKTAVEATAETTNENNGEPAVSTCRHHWVIQPADGPVSNGSCQVCGETREFKNYVESATWGDSRITNKAATASTAESTSDDEDVSDQQAEDESEAEENGEAEA
ncbi:MAG: hypothetical protein H8E48_13575 [Chloroflexi bacterium]|nr:hypothetical protein [Chloroflexota bacterium]